MKFVKFGILALSLGLFVASCGNSESTESTGDTTTVAPVSETPAPVVADTTAPVTTDSAAATTTPAADTAKH